MAAPSVSVVLATYNGAKHLSAAIASVLSQGFRDLELIVVDDASTDPRVARVAEGFARQDGRVRYLRNPANLERSASKNRGVRESRAPYVAFVDDDDVWSDPDKLARQLAEFHKDPSLVLVGTAASVCDESGRVFGAIPVRADDRSIRATMLLTNPFVQSSVMADKAAFERAGGYPAENLCEDYDLWLRMGRLGKLANLTDPCVRYMVRGGGTTARNLFRMKAISLRLAWKHRRDYPRAWAALAVRCATFPFSVKALTRAAALVRRAFGRAG